MCKHLLPVTLPREAAYMAPSACRTRGLEWVEAYACHCCRDAHGPSDVPPEANISPHKSQHAHAKCEPCGADSSRRAFYREFVKVVDASDVIIEVLDARDPAAYRSPDVERYVRAAGSNKKIILLLNKIGALATASAHSVVSTLEGLASAARDTKLQLDPRKPDS